MRYFLHIVYNGFNYRGWQRQDGIDTVQQRLEEAISRVLKHNTIVFGCGRTDAQVHASQYFAHIDIPMQLDEKFIFVVNKNLPTSIVILEAIKIDDNQNARFDPLERTYTYYMHKTENPFLAEKSTLVNFDELNLNIIKTALTYIEQNDEYAGFCNSPLKHKGGTKCKIRKTSLYKSTNGERMCITIAGNRFLKCMIRILVAKLFELGRGEMTLEEFEKHLKEGTRPKIINPAPPFGLYLSKVVYEYMERENKIDELTVQPSFWLEI